MRHRASWLFAGILALACAGCGEDHGLRTVRGKLLYKGQPATGATVVFHREAATPLPEDQIPPEPPAGVVDDAGAFELTSGDWGWGALPGKYRVTVIWPDVELLKNLDQVALAKRERDLGRDRAHIPPDRLKGRYSKAEKPLLFAEVKPESNDLAPFELTD